MPADVAGRAGEAGREAGACGAGSGVTRDEILTQMRERAHYPATARDLARILKVPREQRATFTRHLKALVASGDLVQVRGNRLGLPEKMDLVVGRLQVNPAGFGFVTPEKKGDGDGTPGHLHPGLRPR